MARSSCQSEPSPAPSEPGRPQCDPAAVRDTKSQDAPVAKALQTCRFSPPMLTPPYPRFSTDNKKSRFARLLEPSDGLEPSTPSLPYRLPIGLFGPFSVLPYLRPVATGCARLAPQTLHGFPEFGGLLVDGLRAVAGEQPHGRLVGQFRGGDVGGGSEGEAGFLDGHVDEVWQSGPLARDARVKEAQREQLADLGDGRDGGGEERVVLPGV